MKIDGFVKSSSAALHCILRRCGVLPSTPHSSGIVRLASGAFYEPSLWRLFTRSSKLSLWIFLNL
ncbi:MAG: hypothetical protein NTY64_03135 [Deltaproteobacteria bacterium]|nr:hypothetical protein [Deltaproteobacteria bacterium]